jgi:hypothetical protein
LPDLLAQRLYFPYENGGMAAVEMERGKAESEEHNLTIPRI